MSTVYSRSRTLTDTRREDLASDGSSEARQRQHATPAPRLAPEPVAPLQASTSHPKRRTRHATGKEIERSADSYCNSRAKLSTMAGDPTFLSGGSEGDEEDVGPGRTNTIEYIGGPDRVWRARVGAADDRARMPGLQPPNGSFRDPWRPAKQEQPVAPQRGKAREIIQQVYSWYPARHPATQPARRQDDADTVRHDEVSVQDRRTQGGVPLSLDGHLWIERHDVPSGVRLSNGGGVGV